MQWRESRSTFKKSFQRRCRAKREHRLNKTQYDFIYCILEENIVNMAYSYAAIFASEFISTLFAIYLGESIIANEVLAGTKGRAMVSFSTFCLRAK